MKTDLSDILKNGEFFKLRIVTRKEWIKRFKRVKRLQEKGKKRKRINWETIFRK